MIENYSAEKKRPNRKPGIFAGEQGVQVVILAMSYGFGLCLAFAVAYRLPFFVALPRMIRFILVALGGLVTLLLYNGMLKVSVRELAVSSRANWLAWLAVAVLTGCFGAAQIHPPLSRLQTKHTVTIEVLPAPNTFDLINAQILEIHGTDGIIIRPDQFAQDGEWHIVDQGITLKSRSSGRLTYTFSAPDGSLDILFAKHPQGGLARITVDGVTQQSLLSGFEDEKLHLVFSLSGTSRQAALLKFADVVALVSLISLVLFTVPFYSLRIVGYRSVTVSLNQNHYHLAFMVVFIGLLLLPVQNRIGSLAVFDTTFWNRETLLRGWSGFRDRVLGDRVFYRVLVSDNHWLIYTGDFSLDDYQRTFPLREDQLQSFQERLDGINGRLAAKGIKFLVVIPPNKNTIYSEYMPKEVPIIGSQSRLDQITTYQKRHGRTEILDLRTALLEERKEHTLYYSSDTHWNPYGAWIGYREILQALQNDYPNLKPYRLEDYVYHPLGKLPGDMASNLGQIDVKDDYFKLLPKDRRLIDTRTYSMGNIQVTTTTQPDAQLPRIVMYRDSFATELIPLMSEHFSRAVFVSSYTLDEQFIDSEKTNIVILEITERNLYYLF